MINNDKADLASRSARSLPRMLMGLGSQQKTVSLKTERSLYFLKKIVKLMDSYGLNFSETLKQRENLNK